MIATLLLGALKVGIGCTKLGIKGLKAAITMSKVMGKTLKASFKGSKKLGSGIVKVISKSRAIAKNATFNKEAALKRGRERQDQIDEFTLPTVIVKSRGLSEEETVRNKDGTLVLKKARVFTKGEE